VVVSNGPQRGDIALILGGFWGKIPLLFVALSPRWGPLLTTTVPNLGDLLSYGYLGIEELPTHSNTCPSRNVNVRSRYFRLS
jgi:hypothetical protein